MDLSGIETLIQSRQTALAVPELRKLEKKARKNAELLAWVCDGYRRLNRYEDGFRLVGPSTAIKRAEPSDSLAGTRLLWAARFLNLLGASPYALQLAASIRPVGWKDHRIIGNLHLANFDCEHALPFFEKMLELCPPDERSSYAGRLSRIDWADALDGVDRTDEALAAVTAVFQDSSEPYAQAMALQARGEYLARIGRYPEAFQTLEKAARLFPQDDRTPDFAFLLKWLGYAEGRMGQKEQAQERFSQALSILLIPDQRPEAWLDVVRLQHELGLLSEEHSHALCRYPGLAPCFQKRLPPARATAPASLRIDLHRTEWFREDRSHWGLDLELKLLAFLTLASPWGISAERLKPLLWPEDLYSYPQLSERLRKLLVRVESRFGVEILDRKGFLLLQGNAPQVVPGPGDGRPSFLEGRSSFAPAEMGEYYDLKRTQRAQVLQQWIDRNWIQREGSAARPVYRVG